MLAEYKQGIPENWTFLWHVDLIIKCQCCPHAETSQLIYTTNQLTGFYMRATLAFNGLINEFLHLISHRIILASIEKIVR